VKTKQFSFKAVGPVGKLGEGKPVTPEQLAIINEKFSNVPLQASDIWTRELLLCHSAIDRDLERFNPLQLNVFNGAVAGKGIVGKGFFAEGHPGGWSGKNGPGQGRYFASRLQQMTPQEFQQLTGELPQLPHGETQITCLFATPYMLRLDSNEDTRKNIDAGTQHFVSIGFDAPFRCITDPATGDLIYGEYCPTQDEQGEALEGSLVWLGAQPGAGMMKGAKATATLNHVAVSNADSLIASGTVDKTSAWSITPAEEDAILGNPPNWHKYSQWHLGMDSEVADMTKGHFKYPIGKGGKLYRSALIAIRQRSAVQGATDIFDAAGKLVSAIDKEQAQHTSEGGKTMKEFLKRLGEKLGKTFTEEKAFDDIAGLISSQAEELKTLKPLAEEGKAYRKHLIEDYLKGAVLMGEVKEDAESQKAEADFLMTVPIDRLKAMTDKAVALAKKDFPAEFTVKTGDSTGKHADSAQAGAGSEGDANAVVNDAKKRAEAAGKK
jgi:hypothetical protein